MFTISMGGLYWFIMALFYHGFPHIVLLFIDSQPTPVAIWV